VRGAYGTFASLADGIEGRLPDPIAATLADLPAAVAEALANPGPPRRSSLPAAGYTFGVRSWGDPAARPLLLIHGVTASAATWWRVGPALAASGRHVVSPDLPGHGQTGPWRGRHHFAETAEDLLGFIRGAGLEQPDLQVIGHSWGGMVCAALPAAGLRPERLVLLDPPRWTEADFRAYVLDPGERHFDDLAAATAAMRATYPAWDDRDVHAKAEGLTEFSEAAARSIVLENGDWDSGLAALADPAARDIQIWYVKGEAASGSLIPDAWLPELAARVGSDHVLTVGGGAHSPQRMRPEATLLALLRALDG